MAIPGVVQAEYFDVGGEGIAVHNINIDTNAGPALRTDAGVEVRASGATLAVNTIRDGEWLKYTVEIAQAAFYSMSMTVAALKPPAGMQFSMWLDVPQCPPSSMAAGQLLRILNPGYAGTGGAAVFGTFNAGKAISLPKGTHTITLCFETGLGAATDMGIAIDSFELQVCGATAEDCKLPAGGGAAAVSAAAAATTTQAAPATKSGAARASAGSSIAASVFAAAAALMLAACF